MPLALSWTNWAVNGVQLKTCSHGWCSHLCVVFVDSIQ